MSTLHVLVYPLFFKGWVGGWVGDVLVVRLVHHSLVHSFTNLFFQNIYNDCLHTSDLNINNKYGFAYLRVVFESTFSF
jgi:hypothetical protein